MKINMPNNWNRKLHRLWKKLEPELASLDFAAQEFVCQACSAYLRGRDISGYIHVRLVPRFSERLRRSSEYSPKGIP
jgi:hypothetical protein